MSSRRNNPIYETRPGIAAIVPRLLPAVRRAKQPVGTKLSQSQTKLNNVVPNLPNLVNDNFTLIQLPHFHTPCYRLAGRDVALRTYLQHTLFDLSNWDRQLATHHGLHNGYEEAHHRKSFRRRPSTTAFRPLQSLRGASLGGAQSYRY